MTCLGKPFRSITSVPSSARFSKRLDSRPVHGERDRLGRSFRRLAENIPAIGSRASPIALSTFNTLNFPLLLSGAKAREHAEILQRRCVALDLAPGGDLLQQAAHDFS